MEPAYPCVLQQPQKEDHSRLWKATRSIIEKWLKNGSVSVAEKVSHRTDRDKAIQRPAWGQGSPCGFCPYELVVSGKNGRLANRNIEPNFLSYIKIIPNASWYINIYIIFWEWICLQPTLHCQVWNMLVRMGEAKCQKASKKPFYFQATQCTDYFLSLPLQRHLTYYSANR